MKDTRTNQEQAKRQLPFILAAAEGKEVQYHSPLTSWREADWSEIANCNPGEIRIKPEPKFRPWKPEEVPMPCILRSKECHGTRWMVLSVSKYGVGTSDAVGVCSFELLLNHNEHSTDNGKNWKPCGVEL